MWMIELATNTSTADSRIGSHSDKNDVTPTSPGCLAEFLDAGSRLHTRLRARRSLRLAGRAEHWTTGIREVEPALAVRHVHAVCPQKIEAEQHLAQLALRRQAASGRASRDLEAGEANVGIADQLVADAEALEGADPLVGALGAETAAAAGGDGARRLRRDADAGSHQPAEYRGARAGVDLRQKRLAVQFHRDEDSGLHVVDLELHDAGTAARPIRERYVAALLRLEQTHRVVGQVELDVDLPFGDLDQLAVRSGEDRCAREHERNGGQRNAESSTHLYLPRQQALCLARG